MQWTRDPPTVPGWYWMREVAADVEIVWIDSNMMVWVQGVDDNEPVSEHAGVEWCGPLTPPV